MNLKKLDGLMAGSFIPPFIVTFFIALFVFVMQTLWIYIDDIAGKGVGFFLLVELVAYMSVSMIPMALPVAVLISSVMVLGNMAERYELSSFKSAGVSLWRVMRPLMVLTTGIGLLSFVCSNFVIPVSNLKFKSRLHDIRNQKPALSLQESIFNNDFQGYSIRLGDKLPDDRTIRDVILFDNKDANQGRLTMVAADSGNMYGSIDGKFFVMHLFDGNQYSEPKPVTKDGRRNFPMMRASFKEWTKVFDLNEFEMDRTDENLFKSHHTMLSNRQLLIAIDSIEKEIVTKISRMKEGTNRHYFYIEKAFEEMKREERRREAEERKAQMDAERDSVLKSQPAPPPQNDTAPAIETEMPARPPERKLNVTRPQGPNPKLQPTLTPAQAGIEKTTEPPVKTPAEPPSPWPQVIVGDVKNYGSLLATFEENKRPELLEKAKGTARTLRDQAENVDKSLKRTKQVRVKHVFEFYSKFSLAVACFIFLFVGAPMGAIVRKGGFGWPLLISIVFFMLFIIISIFSKNIAERSVIDGVLAAWMSCLVIFPMGLVLTYWAMRDIGLTQLVDFFWLPLMKLKKLIRPSHPES